MLEDAPTTTPAASVADTKVARLNTASLRKIIEPEDTFDFAAMGKGQVIADELLSVAGLAVLNRVYGDGPEGVAFFQLDVPMVAAAVALSLLAGTIAGLYPAWRICAVPPARHLKSQ